MEEKKTQLKLNRKPSNLAIKKDKKSDLDKFNETLNKKKHKIDDSLKIIVLVILLVALIGIVIYIMKNYNKTNNDEVIISEENFLQDTYDVLSHKDDYIGKTITLEGIYSSYTEGDKIYKMVYRNTPGTNGNNGMAAFDISYAGEVEVNDNDWVKVTGILEQYEDEIDHKEYLIIKVKALEKIEAKNKFVIK